MALKIKKVDTSKSAEARWEQYDEDTKVLLMPLDNQQYQVALERMRRQLGRSDAAFEEGKVGVVPGEKTEHEKHCLLLASFILKDWQGALDENDKEIGYTEAAGAEMLKGDTDFFVFVIQKARYIADENQAEAVEVKGKQ